MIDFIGGGVNKRYAFRNICRNKSVIIGNYKNQDQQDGYDVFKSYMDGFFGGSTTIIEYKDGEKRMLPEAEIKSFGIPAILEEEKEEENK